jgi:DNA polymerase-3 subunit epsilon
MYGKYAFVDIESTGLDTSCNEIIEIAIIVVDLAGDICESYLTLVKPEQKVPSEVSALTGISNKMLEDAPPFYQVADKIEELLQNKIFVAHKIDFDYQVLSREFEKLGKEFKYRSKCTLKLSRDLLPGMASYGLKELCQFFHIPYKNTHRAYPDALASYHLFQELEKYYTQRENTRPNFLPKHKKIVDGSPNLSGVITLKSEDQKIIKKVATENIRKWFESNLSIGIKNRDLYSNSNSIEYQVTGSYLLALLTEAESKRLPKWSVFIVKNKKGLDILKLGTFKPGKTSLRYFQKRKDAEQFIGNVVKELKPAPRLQRPMDREEVRERNLSLDQCLKKYQVPQKNLLVRSTDQIAGEFQYVVVKNQTHFATFKSAQNLKKIDDYMRENLHFKKFNANTFTAFVSGLKTIKTQKRKTDYINEISAFK